MNTNHFIIDADGVTTAGVTKAGRRLAGAQLEKVRQALAVIGELVKWAGYEDEVPADAAPEEKSVKSTAVKILDQTPETLIVGGYGVVFGGSDLEGETFTKGTNYHLDLVPSKPILYDHGFNLKLATAFLGKSTKVEMDDDGLWIEAELDRHAAYMEQVGELLAAGVLGWSSGSVGHLVRRENGIIKSWPIVEFSLTPTPAEPRTLGVGVLKALADVDATYSALLPEAEASAVDGADGADTEATKSSDLPITTEETIMADEATKTEPAAIDVAAIAQEAATKAVAAFVAAQTPTNAVEPVTMPNVVKSLGDNPVKALLHYVRTGDGGAIKSYDDPAMKAYNNTDMNMTTAADGEVAVPVGMVQNIMARRDEMSLVTKLGVTRVPGKGTTVNYPIDNEADVIFASVAESGEILQDAPALTEKAFTLVKYGKHITLTWELLADEDAQLEAFLTNWIARGYAATQNSLLITEALANGTAGLTFDAAAAIGAGEIPELVGKLGPEYQEGAQWVMHPTTYAYLAGIASSSIFTFAPNPAGNLQSPSQTLWGYPLNLSSYATAYAASAKSTIFGNFAFMGYREAPGLTILRDPYSAAHLGQTKLWVWFRTVFGVLQAEAIQYATHPTA